MQSDLFVFPNPFRPGAGHMPPHLAGREREQVEFDASLKQEVILENTVLTGLRGVGKTVLMETLKPGAFKQGWAWVGSEISESASISEENLAIRLLTDLSVFTTSIRWQEKGMRPAGFTSETQVTERALDYPTLLSIYNATPGLIADKLKGTLEVAWGAISSQKRVRGIVFAYDEAQNLADHAARNQFPLSVLLDVFQSLQRKGVRFMLLLVGLPTLFPKLVQARTYAERMFHVITIGSLTGEATRDAILKPVETAECPVTFASASVKSICETSGGYPYFIQFICREAFEVWTVDPNAPVPIASILHKLDSDFFVGRWSRATDRQRDLLTVIASLPNCDEEFTVAEIVARSKAVTKPFTASHVSQLLTALAEAGLTYRNRHGKYAFAVPLMGSFIRRQRAAEHL